MIVVRHPRFVLRQYERGDLPELLSYYGHPEVLRNVSGRSRPYRRAEAERYLTEKLRQYRRGRPATRPDEIESMGYAIEVDGRFAGGVGYTLHGHRAVIGYWLGRPFWGRGIMTEVVRSLTAHLARTHGVRRVEAKVFPFNPASARVLEKAGFVLEGRLRKNHAVQGRLLDHLLYARVR
jgi:RimJ/RimL family protein N-acetyltransferase